MNIRRLLLVLVLCLPVCLVALAAPPGDARVYPVVRAIDGDTIVVNIDGKETKVRLIGIDTPETVDPRKAVQAFGKEASEFTRKLLQGESVVLEYDQEKTDKYGRTLAYVYRAKDRLLINREIIWQGYGHAYTRFPFAKMEDFRAVEKEAREAKRGLWGDSKAESKPPVKAETGSVFMTHSGAKYHVEGCRHLATSKLAVSLDEAKKKGLEPCAVCNPPK